ncbi:MAG: EpsI family protein, partial [Desulfobacteraceae bacterium]|nr:EpsI family protein [Desulfobacteraceae bacterium]
EKLIPQKQAPMPKMPESNKNTEIAKQDPIKKIGLTCPRFILSVMLLAITMGITQKVEFRELIPLSQPFSRFPMTVAQWEGTPQKMEQEFIDKLDLNDYVMASFQNPAGKAIDLYIAYYDSQQKGESIHSPATCLRGSGWTFKKTGKAFLFTDQNTTIPVNRAVIEKGPLKQIAYYWFPSRGRNLTNAYEMKWFNFWDALTRQRTDGALVRLISQSYPQEQMEDTEKRLQEFSRAVAPYLQEFLPQ